MIEKAQKEILRQKKLFIFDLDGTIYLDNVLFPKALDLLELINSRNNKYVFLTNNSSKSSEQYLEKLIKLGISCDKTNIATSTQATIEYLQNHHPNESFFIVGTKAMISEIKEAGITSSTEYHPNLDGVILGYDTELVYEKLVIASKLLTEGKKYIATHPDLVCPVEFGFVPDCGAFAKMLEYATNRKPLVIGKPKSLIVDMILKKTKTAPDNAILVGDRLYTDIACGRNALIDTLLVLSGETKLEDLKDSSEKPTFILNDVASLYEILSSL